MSEAEVIRCAGVDAAMYIKILRMGGCAVSGNCVSWDGARVARHYHCTVVRTAAVVSRVPPTHPRPPLEPRPCHPSAPCHTLCFPLQASSCL